MTRRYRVGRCAPPAPPEAPPDAQDVPKKAVGHLVCARRIRRPAFNVVTSPRGRRRGGGFTLVELLVVVGIIALLVTILTPALGRAMALARRAVCATNLGSIGRGLMLYDTEYKTYPYVALNGGGWGVKVGTNRDKDPRDGERRDRSPSSCLYLLVRKSFTGRGHFLCPAGGEKLAPDHGDYWDFADGTQISYAVMNPYGPEKLFNISAKGTRPLMADSSPYFEATSGLRNDADPVNLAAAGLDEEQRREGNSPNHRREGQNVSLMGGSTEWQDSADVGTRMDNIYTRSEFDNSGDRKGSLPDPGPDGSADDQGPSCVEDSYLIQ